MPDPLRTLPRTHLANVQVETAAIANQAITSSKLHENTIQYVTGTISNAEMLALRATPKTLVSAPAAGRILEFLTLALFFDVTAAYTETADNMAVRYTNGTGAIVSEAIEATGFVDATADTMTICRAKNDQIVAKTGCDAQALVLHNTGDGEYGGGNAANSILFKITYKVHTAGW